MYLTLHDDEFREKRDDVLRLYYEAPKNEPIVCVDQKTGIQALERRYADIAMEPGQPMRREFEYVRHGTLCWMGAFDVRRGKPFGFTSQGHDSDTFVELLDVIDVVYPPGRGHIVMDNLSTYDTPDVNEWFDEHPRWTRHFTPKHASWLNQIECWLSILARQLLTRGSFTSQEDLAAKIDAYVAWYLQNDRPFKWSYREHNAKRRQMNVHGLRSTFVTISLANGRSETWVMDRTGHRSSAMVNRYRRVARTVAELGLGPLAPLNEAIPEACDPEGAGKLQGPSSSEEVSAPDSSTITLAERKGFEPPVPFSTPDFQSGTFDHSVTSPVRLQRTSPPHYHRRRSGWKGDDARSDTGEVDEPTGGIGCDELHPRVVADVETLLAADEPALGGRVARAYERALGRDAGDHRVERLADATGEEGRRGHLSHGALELARAILHLRAMRRYLA